MWSMAVVRESCDHHPSIRTTLLTVHQSTIAASDDSSPGINFLGLGPGHIVTKRKTTRQV